MQSHTAGCRPVAGVAFALALVLNACGPPSISDPLAALSNAEAGPQIHLAAMDMLDSGAPAENYQQALRRIIGEPGYTVDVREAALARLETSDLDALKRTIELRLPTLTALEWRRRLCEIIAERGWKDLSPTLVRAWATPIRAWIDKEAERPEFMALAKLHGRDQVEEVVFNVLMTASSEMQPRLRAHAWELLLRLGKQERLVALLRSSQVPPDDAMLLDLQAGLAELGILPANYEEILWLRQLRQPEHAGFWSAARSAMEHVPAQVAREMELRTLPIVVAAYRHEPELLAMSSAEMQSRVQQHVRTTKRHAYTVNFDGWAGEYPQRLNEYRDQLKWGDFAAMLMAVRALEVPQVDAHLFDIAERDRADKSTEYGGIISLDEQGRFQVVEFAPRRRDHDNRYNTPPEMVEAAYTALFHFHNHTQKYDNQAYAGPHIGDLNYADNLRSNCLVFTFINKDTLNVDFYRHTRVIVDLGEIRRPAGVAAGPASGSASGSKSGGGGAR